MADFGFLQVRSSPTGPPRVTVRGEGLFVHVLEDDGDAALVVAQWSDGSRVRGWVERSALREPEREEALRIGRAMGGLAELDVGSAIPLSAWASRATVGLGGGRLWMRRPHRAEPAAPLVSAAIAIGSRVYAAPGRGAWATVARDTLFEVSARPLCEWVAIARAPGLTIPSLRAWVRAGTLRIGR